mgnify:CR=1 FL=1
MSIIWPVPELHRVVTRRGAQSHQPQTDPRAVAVSWSSRKTARIHHPGRVLRPGDGYSGIRSVLHRRPRSHRRVLRSAWRPTTLEKTYSRSRRCLPVADRTKGGRSSLGHLVGSSIGSDKRIDIKNTRSVCHIPVAADSDELKQQSRERTDGPGWQSPAERVRLQSGSSPVQIRPLALARYVKAQDDIVLGSTTFPQMHL